MTDMTEYLGGVSKEKFRSAVNRLLNENFLLKKCKDTSSDYLFLISNRDLIAGYLDLIGYELIINEEYGVVTLGNPFGTGRIHLSKRESILLLIIRILYIEKKKELTQSDDAIVLMEEIYDKYNLMKLQQKLRKDQLQSALGKFKRLHLIWNLDRMDTANMDVRIEIYPSILFAVSATGLDELYQKAQEKLAEYENGGDEDGRTDDADDEEVDED